MLTIVCPPSHVTAEMRATQDHVHEGTEPPALPGCEENLNVPRR